MPKTKTIKNWSGRRAQKVEQKRVRAAVKRLVYASKAHSPNLQQLDDDAVRNLVNSMSKAVLAKFSDTLNVAMGPGDKTIPSTGEIVGLALQHMQNE